MSRLQVDTKRNARYSDVDLGDQVLVRQDKSDKLTSTFATMQHTVVKKHGNSLVVQSPTGATYSRNTSLVKKFVKSDGGEGECTASALMDDPLPALSQSPHCAEPDVPGNLPQCASTTSEEIISHTPCLSSHTPSSLQPGTLRYPRQG